MYAPNEYYKPYNPNKGRDRYRERQRLPAQYVSTEDKDKTPTFRMLSSPAPPAPPSLNTYSSLTTMEDLLPGKMDRTECYCRISSLVKAFVFLGILLGATVGLVIFFLNNPGQEGLKANTTNNFNVTNGDHFSKLLKNSESSENFLGDEGEVDNRKIPTSPNTTTTRSSDTSDASELPHHDIRQEYEKVLNGFEDGEYNLDVKELFGEDVGLQASEIAPNEPAQDNTVTELSKSDSGKEDIVDDLLPTREPDGDILTSPTASSPLSVSATASEDAPSAAGDSSSIITSNINSVVESSLSQPGEMITETVFGFLNLVTTVRDTVLVFSSLGEKSSVETEQIPSTNSEVSTAPVISAETITTTTEATTTTSTTTTTTELNILLIKPTSSFDEEQLEDSTDSDYGSLDEDSVEIFLEDQEKRTPKSKFQNLKLKTEEEDTSIEDERHSAELSFKERLKARFKKFRQEHGDILVKTKGDNSGARPTVESAVEVSTTQSQARVKEGKERPKFGKRTDFIRKKLAEVLKHTSKTEESTFQRTFVPSFLRTESKTDFTRIRPTIARSLFTVDASTRAPFSFNRNKNFKRPEIRKNILNKILGKVKEDEESDEVDKDETEDVVEIEKENEEEEKVTEKIITENVLNFEEETTTDSFIEPSTTTRETLTRTSLLTQDLPIFQQFSPSEFPESSTIQSSMDEVSVPPQSSSRPTALLPAPSDAPSEVQSTILVRSQQTDGAVYEVATIKSAYSFTVEDGELSTRYITVTRTSSSELSSPAETTLLVSTAGELEVATIRSAYSFQVGEEGEESSTRYVTVTRTLTQDVTNTPLPPPPSLPFDIINFQPSPILPTLSQDVVTRTAVIPVVVEDGVTSLSTLTHSFTVTNSLTIEPTASFDPEHIAATTADTSFIDIDRDFDSQESINRESFLPIELGIVNNNQIQPAKVPPAIQDQLNLLPFPQVVTVSTPVVRTETRYLTSTIRLLQGNSAFQTTLLEPLVTTVTEYSEVTSTLPHPLQPTTTIITHPVTLSTVLTHTETQSYRVIFRAKPITTTVLDTKTISTVVTSFQTQTVTLPPILPLLG